MQASNWKKKPLEVLKRKNNFINDKADKFTINMR